MNSPEESTAADLDARTAELLARQINTAFTTSSGYGPDHPMSIRSFEALLKMIHDQIRAGQEVSLLLDRGALFIEKHPVGKRFSPTRMINLLAQMRIESISLGSTIDADSLQELMSILADREHYPDVAAAQNAIKAKGIKGIRLNYVTYKKVTADQKVVGSDEVGGSATPGQIAGLMLPEGSPEDSFGSLASMLSLDRLLKDPETYAQQISEQREDDDQRAKLVRQLRYLISQVESGEIEAEGLMNSETLLRAVNALRKKIKQQHQTDRNIETLLSEQDQVVDELDQLTYSTLVSLVREEYRAGSFSARRLAQIINRMLPDPRDLKRLLPQLKQGLLAEGMSVGEYGELVHALSAELRGEHLVRALEVGAESVGLDVEEIVEQIREDPAEAARLIVLATELRRTGVENEDQLSSAFADYVERISEKLADASGSAGPEDQQAVARQLERIQQLLIEQLARQGLPEELIRELRIALEERRRNRSNAPAPGPDQAVGNGIGNTAKAEKPAPEHDVLSASDGPEHQAEPGHDEPTQTPADAGSRPGQTEVGHLPAGILKPANTAWFLNREAKIALRYQTPFSVIMLSMEWLRRGNNRPERPTATDLAGLAPQVFQYMIDHLRDLDLIGSLDRRLQAVPIAILSMTAQKGAEALRRRLSKNLMDAILKLGREDIRVIPCVSAASFDPKEDKDLNGFMLRLHAEHEDKRTRLAKALEDT